MIIDLKEIETLELASDNALGFAPGWYAIAPNRAKCWGPFDTVGALGDWLLGRVCEEVGK